MLKIYHDSNESIHTADLPISQSVTLLTKLQGDLVGWLL